MAQPGKISLHVIPAMRDCRHHGRYMILLLFCLLYKMLNFAWIRKNVSRKKQSKENYNEKNHSYAFCNGSNNSNERRETCIHDN